MSQRSTAQHCHIDTPFCTIRKSHVTWNFAVPGPHSELVKRSGVAYSCSYALLPPGMRRRVDLPCARYKLTYAYVTRLSKTDWKIRTRLAGVVKNKNDPGWDRLPPVLRHPTVLYIQKQASYLVNILTVKCQEIKTMSSWDSLKTVSTKKLVCLCSKTKMTEPP